MLIGSGGALACTSLSCSDKNVYQYGKFGQALQCHTILIAIIQSKSGSNNITADRT